MERRRWIKCFALCASLAGGIAFACGFFGPGPSDFVMFDAQVTGDTPGLSFDPDVIGLGGPCVDCGTEAMTTDWHGYLKGAVSDADWKVVLLSDKHNEVVAMRGKLAKKGDRVKDALAFVDLARRVEPFAILHGETRPPGSLLTDAQAAMKAAREPFLAQRYAFQVLRVLFYQHDFTGAVAFYDKNAAVLSAPSTDLAWRARYYMAGAAKRAGNRARANLELARIHAGYAPLATVAAEDFKPMEDSDWRDSLKLAKDVRDKTLLWRLVGVRTDGIVAMQEIQKLDPKSDLLALLLVRELARAESAVAPAWDTQPDPKEAEAGEKAFKAIDTIAAHIIGTPGADRPWIALLVRGHIAARRGDVEVARRCLDKAMQAAPNDPRVANQARASLAVALAQHWKIDPARETELANTMAAIDRAKFGPVTAVDREVRGNLAAAYEKVGRLVDAEFLKAGSVKSTKWRERKFLEAMIARTEQSATAFDRLVLQNSFTRGALDQELATRELYDGDFAAAAQMFQAKAHSDKLHVDPFVVHVIDCHDCDQEKYANAKWTHQSLAARLAELEKTANGQGEAAAKAAFDIGAAMYNVTWFGNARVFAESTHQRTGDTTQAEAWFERAYKLSKNRELRAKAAWQAAKAELGRLENLDVDQPWQVDGQNTPAPKKWFGVMKQLADTKYYKEALAECSRFRAFVAQ